MISFSQPGMLWGLCALVVPVILHLLGRRKSVRLDFSTLRFLQKGAATAGHLRKLKRLLLLFARLLLIISLTLLFAQPVDKSDPLSQCATGAADLYTWVDPSLSMEYVDAGSTLREKAWKCVDSAVAAVKPPTQVSYFDNKSDLKATSLADVRSHGETPRFGTARIGPIMRGFAAHTARSRRAGVLLMLSDCAPDLLLALDSMLNDKPGLSIVLADVAPDNQWNFAISKAMVSAESPSAVTVQVKAFGRKLDPTIVAVYKGELRTGEGLVHCNSNDSCTVTINVSGGIDSSGCVIRLDVDDPLKADNSFFMVPATNQTHHILIVGDSAASIPLFAAYRSFNGEFWGRVEIADPAMVGFKALDSADLIVLNEPKVISQQLSALFLSNRITGKGLLVACDADKGHSVQALSFLRLNGLLPNELAIDPSGLPIRIDTLLSLWQGFSAMQSNDVRIYGWRGPLGGVPLVTMSNHQPLVSEMRTSAGDRVIVVATPLGATMHNNLCETGWYVPMIDRLSRRAIGGAANDNSWRAGQWYENPFWGERLVGTVYRNDQTEVTQWSTQRLVSFDEPGCYRIESNTGVSRWMGVNTDPIESDCNKSPASIRTSKNIRKIIMVDGASLLARLRNQGMLFQNGLWLLVGLLLIAEVLLWERSARKP